MSSQSEDRLVWIAIGLISGLSAVSAVVTVVNDGLVLTSAVDPSSGCKHVVRGKDEAEVLKNAMEHAKSHGIREVTPELKAKVKAAIRDAK